MISGPFTFVPVVLLALLLGKCVSAYAVTPRPIYMSTTANGLPAYSSEPDRPGAQLYLTVGDPPPRPRQPRLSFTAMERTPSEPMAFVNLRRPGIDGLVEAAAKQYNVPRALLMAVMHTESHFNPNARSPVGAIGLMQIMPPTGRRYGVHSNLAEPSKNIDVGTRYLKDLLHLFKGDTRLAVAAYNAGEGAVIKYGHRIPPYAETRAYVPKVMELYQHYSKPNSQ